ncbi:hypothetical protein WMY93_015405 [Mugilogobius chulae]|uniref:Uncharacterized protein n=1 Tax=Mugilogobius chulae TaxID=88201 RepID=A0AAW0NWG9_9GOBI
MEVCQHETVERQLGNPAGDYRIRPERDDSVLLRELRLQSGPRVHRRIYFPLHKIQRPERNYGRRTVP